MKITWIGQSGYKLDDGNTCILIDPYLSDVVNKVANRPRMIDPPFTARDFKGDAVVCTHDHLDHLDVEAVPDFDKNITIIAPPSCEKKLRELEREKIKILPIGESVSVGNFTLTAVPAFHTVEAIGILLQWKEYKLYFSSDTLYDSRLAEMKRYKPDIMFICINGRLGNMNVEEAVQITRAVNPRVGVPTHYGMFESNTEDPKKYTSQIKNSFEMQLNTEYEIEEILEASK